MKNETIGRLLEKFRSGQCAPDEELALKTWLHQYNMIGDSGLSEADFLEAKTNMLTAINSSRFPIVRKARIWPRIAIAAAVFTVIFCAGLFYYTEKNSAEINFVANNDIAPGRNGATLTLANGEKISIHDAMTGNIASQTGVKISKTKDGMLIYEVVNQNSSTAEYNTLSTTQGEQTQVRLPDGSVAFLNAASSLKYPTSFKKQQKRSVVLTGEGYFEIAKDKLHPFVVSTAGQEVEVLGTHFNINSYSASARTTLLEGAIKISSKYGPSKILKPNQQAILTSNGISVKDIEAEYEIAWKEGFFMFNNESLESIMDKVSRWYNVKVIYEDENLKNKSFIGTINKFEHISKVLHMLEKTNVATFTIHKNVVTIKRK